MRDGEAVLLTGAYATDALDAAEVVEFESHLAVNEVLRVETTELVDTAVLLGLSVTPVEPSAALKISILALIEATTTQTVPDEDPDHEIATDVPPAEVEELPLAARIRWFQRPAAVVLGAAVAIAILSGALITGATVSTSQEKRVSEAAFRSVSRADDAHTATAKVAGGGTATIAWSSSLQSAAVTVNDVDVPSVGSVYELWFIGASGPRAAGTLYPIGGTGARVLAGELEDGDTIGITVEPSGGSAAPTAKPIATVATAA